MLAMHRFGGRGGGRGAQIQHGAVKPRPVEPWKPWRKMLRSAWLKDVDILFKTCVNILNNIRNVFMPMWWVLLSGRFHFGASFTMRMVLVCHFRASSSWGFPSTFEPIHKISESCHEESSWKLMRLPFEPESSLHNYTTTQHVCFSSSLESQV